MPFFSSGGYIPDFPFGQEVDFPELMLPGLGGQLVSPSALGSLCLGKPVWELGQWPAPCSMVWGMCL
jgi:hypothetical protein